MLWSVGYTGQRPQHHPRFKIGHVFSLAKNGCRSGPLSKVVGAPGITSDFVKALLFRLLKVDVAVSKLDFCKALDGVKLFIKRIPKLHVSGPT